MTIETDSETIRKHFTPEAPPIQARFHTLEKLVDAGIPIQVAIAPILPSGEYFPNKLKPFVDRICIDDYFMGDGSGGKRTRKLGIEKIRPTWFRRMVWTASYKKVYKRFIDIFPENQIYVSQTGFEP